MNMHQLPGFTGEASLHGWGQFRAAINGEAVIHQRVVPQLPIGFCMANCDRIDDDFMRSVCNLNCLGDDGGGGGGGPVDPGCRPGCGPCRRVPGERGRTRTCINRDCDERTVRC